MNEDHDKLIRIESKVDHMCNMLSNHLKHHEKYTYFFIITIVGLVLALLKIKG